MFKRLFVLVAVLSLLFCVGFSKMGAGLYLGNPFGLYGRYFLNSSSFVDARISYSGSLAVAADYLLYEPSLVKFEKFVFPLHYGAGATVGFFGSSILLGARVPVGLNYAFMDGKLDVALEAALDIRVIPSFNLGATGGVSVVYYFDK
ncbi:MAG TPA: hypothetical protein PLU28_02885 [Petrotogaceae bacterium]|nr:hypothetical protein [Petrotogaceae bacterium]